jgi:hypothetical protein
LSHYYLDASALVKRYVDEVGSDWLRTIPSPSSPPMTAWAALLPSRGWQWTTPTITPKINRRTKTSMVSASGACQVSLTAEVMGTSLKPLSA